MTKFEKFLWRIWKIKSSDSSLNLCPLNELSHVGRNQDEPEIDNNRLSSHEWCNCQKCEKMLTGLEWMCCHKIPKVKAFHLKGKPRACVATKCQKASHLKDKARLLGIQLL